jgi:phage-related minor tail protein
MELGSRSLAAMQEGLRESVASLAASFGDMLLPASTQVVGILTDMTNAINESPVLKGLLAGAVVTLSGYLAVLAVKQAVAAAKTWLHYAAQMSLNTALSIGNPLLVGALAAAGAATAAFVMYAAEQQKAADKTNDAALAARDQKDALVAAKTAAEDYVRALEDMTMAERKAARENLGAQLFRMQQNLAELESQLNAVPKTIDTYATAYGPGGQTAKVRTGTNDNPEYTKLKAAYDKLKQDISALGAKFDAAGSYEATLSKGYADFGTEWSDKMRTGVAAVMREKEKALDALQQKAREIFKADWADAPQYQREREALNAYFAGKIEDLNKAADAAAKAAADATAKWKESWGETWAQFEAEQAHDPFAGIESDRAKKLRDAAAHNVTLETDKKTIDEINAYYDAKRSAVLEKLAHEEAKLTKTRIDDLEYEFREALKNIDALEAQRVIAAGDSEEAIKAIRERFASLRQETENEYGAEIAKAPLEEARAAIVDWQSSLADALSQGLINLGWFSDEASVILGDLAAQFTDLAASASLGGFEEFGRALAEGENAADSMNRALAAMMQQILRQLPTMFLQAGLQLIINGQWPLGLGFIAAAGAAAFVSGYVDGTVSNAKEDADKAAKENAKGGVYDAYGRAAREYAAGGAFTNQIVSRPTYFRYGGGLGVMGEAGPEAIVPLTRGSDGRLGVSSYGAASAGTAVYVIIQNYTNEDVRTEHSSDADGTQIRKIIIGAVKESITGGGMDRPLASRYGLRAQGVS